MRIINRTIYTIRFKKFMARAQPVVYEFIE